MKESSCTLIEIILKQHLKDVHSKYVIVQLARQQAM